MFENPLGEAPSHDEQAQWGEAVLSERLSAPALSWTPPAQEALAQGMSYVWYVRGLDTQGQGSWSAGRQFVVDVGADEAFGEVVHQALDAELSAPQTVTRLAQALRRSGALLPGVVPTPAPAAGAAPPEAPAAPEAASEGTVQPRATFNSSAFRVSSASGVVFDDPNPSGGGGTIPAEGPGARFMWYPGKRALRAGQVVATQWDDANVGDYSTALGYNLTASGNGSIALGDGTTAESYAETAIGIWDTEYDPVSTTSWEDTDRLFVIGNGTNSSSRQDALVMLKNADTTLNGQLTVTNWASASDTAVCRNGNTRSDCSSSRRYKEAIGNLGLRLATVAGLRPVSFKWKGREERDLGLIAEEVAALGPRLATYDAAGQVEGVKYAQLTAVLVNAVNEQQAEIARQEAQLAEQEAHIAALDQELQGYRELAARLQSLEVRVQGQPMMAARLER